MEKLKTNYSVKYKEVNQKWIWKARIFDPILSKHVEARSRKPHKKSL